MSQNNYVLWQNSEGEFLLKEVHVIETKDGTVDPDNPEDCIVRDYIAIVRIVADVNEMIVR